MGISYTKTVKIPCRYCQKSYWQGKLSAHEKSCVMNPICVSYCAVCRSPVKQRGAITCSKVCSNKHTPRRPRKIIPSDQTYRKICFEHHEKKCVVCGESNIVAVHHYDHNKKNNCPTNLVPLCPTHHTYVHSSFEHMVKSQIDAYVTEFQKRYRV
jgi:hypothetical protein